MSGSVGRLAFAVTAALLAVVVSGCPRETAPPLIQVTRLSPQEVEEGDHLRIEGVGFPEGKVAHVSFQGDLHRPGTPPVSGVVIDLEATVASSSVVELPVTAALDRLFAGPAEHAAHTTFSGNVTVAFAARSPAAPPVAGTLEGAWLDVRPAPPRRAVADAEEEEGERTLSFLGIHAASDPLAAGGVAIESIDAGSVAETSRLLAGDVITEMRGVRVLSVRDLAVAPGEQAAWLKLRRCGNPQEELAMVSLVGLRPPLATALLAPVLVMWLAAALLVLFLAPAPTWFVVLERGVASVLKAGWAKALGWSDSSAGTPHYAAALTLSSLFALVPFAADVIELDAAVVFVVAAIALAAVLAMPGNPAGARRSGALGVVRATARTLSLALPGALALGAAIATSGSLRLDDLARGQGGAPWEWTAFRSPLALVLAVAWGVSLVADDGVTSSARGPRCSSVLSAVVVAHRGVSAALLAAVFFGGWQLPGVAREQLDSHPSLRVVGALVFVLKAWALFVALLAADGVLPKGRSRSATRLAWHWLVPVAAGSCLLATSWQERFAGASVQTTASALLFGLTVVTVVRLVVGVPRVLRAPLPELDPYA